MVEWLYKATPKKVGLEHTQHLALADGFLCRSAFTQRGTRVANTMAVSFGDVIHVYFSDNGTVQAIGSFEIVRKDQHPHGNKFSSLVAKTALFRVADPVFEQRLRALEGEQGYEPDPVEHVMTGWLIAHRSDVSQPTHHAAMFPPRATLLRAP